MPWYKKAISLLEKDSNYILLPSGGHNNANNLKAELENLGKECLVIKDGDSNDVNALKKECIELYAPLSVINETFNISLTTMPLNKDDFFRETTITNEKNHVKRILALKASEFLNADNELINEVKVLLGI